MRRELRLQAGKDFARVYREGRSVGDRNLVFCYLYRELAGPTKVGFSISKKIGSAVKRNLIKRRLRQIVAAESDRIKPGFIAVFVVKIPARDLDFEELRAAAIRLLQKSGLIGGTACA